MAVSACLSLFAVVSVAPTPAGAVLSHSNVEAKFSVGANCAQISDIAVVESTQTIYAACRNPETSDPNAPKNSIRRFDFEGHPLNFSVAGSYLSGNAIIGSPGNPGATFSRVGTSIAVDNSSTHNGYLYVAGDFPNVDVFRPTGEYVTSLPPTFSTYGRYGVAVGSTGNVFTTGWGDGGSIVEEWNPAFHQVRRLYHFTQGTFPEDLIGVDSTGAVWVKHDLSSFTTDSFSKYEEDQFTTKIDVQQKAPASVKAGVQAEPSPLFPDPPIEAPNTQIGQFEVDRSDDSLFINRLDRIEHYSGGTADEVPHQIAPAIEAPALTDSYAVAVTADHHVFASTAGNEVIRFGPGDVLPDIVTPLPAVDDLGHTSATLRADVDLDGGPAASDCTLQFGKANQPYESEVPCAPSTFGTDAQVTATPTSLEEGKTYHYRFRVTTEKGTNFGIDRSVTTAYVLGVKTSPAIVLGQHSVEMRGSLDPDAIPTTYRFQYGPTSGYGFETTQESADTGAGAQTVSATLSELPEGSTWHYRLLASNVSGTTAGPDRTFRVASVPGIGAARATEVTATSAVLNARIDPVGYDTEYRFEYGTTPEYGATIPAPGMPAAEIGSGLQPVDVSQQVTGLRPGLTYHFRVVATNKWGSSAGPDTTLDFAPPACPNDHLRQEAASSYLPDCRAYELVSPGLAGPVRLLPSHAVTETGEFGRWVLNTGRAPGRFAFWGELGSIAGLDAPNSLAGLDMYLATRTPSGWVTTLPGLKGSETLLAKGKECSEAMDLCLDHDAGSLFGATGYDAADLFDADGDRLGRLPTNADTISGGLTFNGAQRISPDFSHFAFSSADVVFAPAGLTGGIGSAYRNDVGTGEIAVISRLSNGNDIPQDGLGRPINFPAISTDGSHVLMETSASNGPSHLFMRVLDGVPITYDVSRGAGVTFVGMTRTGSRVLFLSDAQLTPDDTDSDVDLYQWSEAGDILTRVSQGGGQGNSSQPCAPAWGTSCDVKPLVTERGNPNGNPNVAGLDDKIAPGSGDVYFYSPELLDGSKPGIRNQRNLYVFHDGAVQLVATLEAGTQVNRMQISTDGSHAALLTASQLTPYDNRGFKEIYAYDADSGAIRCASCDPSGVPPSADIEASEGGPFMADDGRVFFTSRDPLTSRDANGEIRDVYEYVDGRPQLITSGTGAQDFTGKGGESIIPVSPGPQFTGLESVSRDGTDVYFSTFETLVDGDNNGNFVKFYDARTGGGFPTRRNLAPCAAADECHGPDSARPSAPVVGTSAELGESGQVQVSRRRCQKGKVRRGKRCIAKRAARRHGQRRNGR